MPLKFCLLCMAYVKWVNAAYSLTSQAAVSGLQSMPIVNAVIDGDDIIYRDYIDISIAVGTPKVFFPSIYRTVCSMP